MASTMLVIRSAQLAVFRDDLERQFEDRLMMHARRYFPNVCQTLGDGLRDTVRDSIQRGRTYGLTTQRELSRFLNLVFTFGRDFDRDPACAWAQPLLRGGLPGPCKISRLYAAAIDHERHARGYFALVGFQNA